MDGAKFIACAIMLAYWLGCATTIVLGNVFGWYC